jgi:hypothetical protein
LQGCKFNEVLANMCNDLKHYTIYLLLILQCIFIKMKRLLLLAIITYSFTTINAQNFTGQWKGKFIDKSTSFMSWGGDQCDYVLELEEKGNKVTGFSYTYFNDGGKRYYTICRLTGFIKKGSKYVEVREVERTKTNVPIHIKNCFQVHKLTLFKQGVEETLEGTWLPAPDQDGDCGKGTTVLSRRVLQTKKPAFNNVIARTTNPKTNTLSSTTTPKAKATPKPPIAKNVKPTLVDVVKNNPRTVPEEVKDTEKLTTRNPIVKDIVTNTNFEKRNNAVIKTIELESETFTVDFYDNGDIDGDTVSVFYNKKLVLSNKKLTDKALTLKLEYDNNITVNEIVMYAENLGSIPPNTAVMIVTDGGKRYEVRITSDLEKSGTIRFVRKPK